MFVHRYLEVVVVLLAAAVHLLGCPLTQVENTAEVTEETRFGDHKLLA